MKTKLLIIAVAGMVVNACTTGTHLIRAYDDDIYFSPADVPPVEMVQNEATVREKPGSTNNSDARDKKIVMRQIEKNNDGSLTVKNNIYQPDVANKNSDHQSYNMDQQDLTKSDTTVYSNDDDVKYVVNNYYDSNNNDLDFEYRINRFHRPYYFDPFFYDDWNYGFYSPFYSGYYGWGGGWGWDPWYSGGWGYPYSYYGGYYSPFSFGLGGYWGGGYGYGGYYNGYYNGYYGGGYYGNGYFYGGGGRYDDRQVARRRSTEMNMPNRQDASLKSSNLRGDRISNTRGGSFGNSSDSKLPTNGAISNTWVENGHVRSRSIDPSVNNQDKNATIVNDRRSATPVDGRRPSNASEGRIVNENRSRTQIARPASAAQGNVRRSYEPSTTGRTYDQNRVASQSQNYTPSYNKPRILNQSNYNSNTYTRPRTTNAGYERSPVKSAYSGGQSYSEPRSSSSMRQTYRSSSTYSSGSSSSPSRSYNYQSSGSSNRSYSEPRSYSPPAQSSGGSGGGYSGGGGNYGGSSGGGGGSGHRR